MMFYNTASKMLLDPAAVMTRRAWLGGLITAGTAMPSALGAAARSTSGAITGQRVVTIGQPATDLIVCLGITPVGAAPAREYRAGISDTILPDAVVDVGQAFEPNLEVIQVLRPDFAIMCWPSATNTLIRSIAPTLYIPVTGVGDDLYGRVEEAVRQMGSKLNRQPEAEHAIAAADASLESAKRRVTPCSIYLVNLDQDGLNIRIYGRHSLMDSVMRRVGVNNAFTGNDNMWGWQVVGLDTLLARPDAGIVHLPEYWEGAGLARQRLMRSPLWRALPQVAAGRVFTLSPIDIYGGLSTATRFAASMADVLNKEGRA